MFNFTPFLGAKSESSASQSLLEFDGGIKILVDVGWDESFNAADLLEIEKHASTISIVLLTHPTLDHLGAFAHCCKHIPQFTKIPVYATTPVISLGRTLLQDLYASNPLAASIIPASSLAEVTYSATFNTDGANPNILLHPPTSEEIVQYFSLINPLKYSQPHQPLPSPFSPPLDGLTITAYNAGHSLGGTIWHILYGLESVIYAVDWNQARENVLSGAAFLSGGGGGAEIVEQLRRPTALICSSKGVERTQAAGGRKGRDEAILSLVQDTISKGGMVLIPSDSSARILELAYILERHWRDSLAGTSGDLYRSSRIHMASRSAGSTIRFAKSMVEWMDEGIIHDMEAANDREKAHSGGKSQPDQTPLDFRHVKLIERKTQIEKVISAGRPGVVLASDTSLDWGFAADALRKLSADRRNLIVLTERLRSTTSEKDVRATVGTRLSDLWLQGRGAKKAANTTVFSPAGSTVTARTSETIPLAGDEQLYYQQYLARRRQMHSTEQGDGTLNKGDEVEVADDQSSESSESDEESDNEQQGRSLNVTATMTQSKRKIGLTDDELGVNILLRRKDIYDYDVRGKKGRDKLFPFVSRRGRNDEFGDLIRPEDYLRAEEKDEIDGLEAAGIDKDNDAVGNKRKWDDAATQGQRDRADKNAKKRAKTGTNDNLNDTNGDISMTNGKDGDSDSEESDYEPDEAVVEGPLKIVFKEEKIVLQSGITHVDFSGLHEKRDLQMLIPLIRPRKLILVAGDAQETLSLAEDCKALLGSDENSNMVHAPSIGEMVDASVDTNAWDLKLSRDLVKRLTWQNVKGLGIVAITGRLDSVLAAVEKSNAEENRRKKLKMIEGPKSDEAEATAQDGKREPVLDTLQSSTMPTQQVVTRPIHVGDLRLADLRRLMQASGHTASFRGEGTLVIDDMVLVRKSASGKIEVEGGAGFMSDGSAQRQSEGTFYAVKRMIYEGLAVVAGS